MSSNNNTSKRIFVGISIPEALVGNISAFCSNIPELIKVKLDYPHITLRFLGNVLTNKILSLTEAVKEIEFSSFELTLEGVGFFGSRSPSVIWVGVRENDDLLLFKKQLDPVLDPFAEKPSGTFTPHITLKRLRRDPNADFFKSMEDFKNKSFGSFRVSSFTVFESILGPSGARHLPLAKVNSVN
ncbi:MAG: RNA 2',3'-cyclic phosphodiesterase [Deltaproteobacteria bacterium]|jgi:2'-5' RNA ligase|nr:RNA 2',3'-cyclic phosphodiesterase [Deltaproteobacteria bacterium]